ncbi:Ubiquitin conjugation factor E4 [Exophiala dermatitidis]
MSEPSLDAEKIRNKRLAKLQQSQPPPSPSPSQGPSASDQDGSRSNPTAQDGTVQADSEQNGSTATSSRPPNTPQESTPPTPPRIESPLPTADNLSKVPSNSASTLATSNSTVPSAEPSHAPSPAPSTRITIQPADGTAQKRDASTMERPSSRQGETIEQWEDRTLRSIFRLSFDTGQTKDMNGQTLYPLPQLKEELEAEGKPILLNTDLLEQAIMEAGANLGKVSPHDWLFGCWKRITRLAKAIKDHSPENKKWTIVSEARRLCMNWCLLSVTTPDIFGAEYDGVAALADHLLFDPDEDRGVCHDFLTEIVARFEEDDSIREIFVGAVETLSRRLAKLTMDSDYRRYTAMLRHLIRYKPLAVAITKSPMFVNPVPAAQLEVATLLGPYFQISPLQAEVTKQYFSGPKTMDPGRIRTAQQSLQMALRAHQTELFDIVNTLVRASPEARERVLDWFALVLNSNHKRRAMRIDKTTVSSDGFMINVNTCLDQLCEPFLDAQFSKIDRVDIDYLRRHPRVDIKDETKINADQDHSDAYYKNQLEGTNNFISELFFLTVAAHYYGSEAARNMLKDMDRELKHMAKQIEQFETERHKYVNNPMQLQMFENALKKYKDQHDKGLSYKYAVQGVLLDELAQTRSMQFMRFVTVWLLRQVSPHRQFPKEPLTLPLPAEQPEAFMCLPEYFLDVISGNFGFIMYNMPQVISATQSDELIMLCITFLRNSEYIKNPYLKASLVTILFRGTWTWRQGGRGILVDQYNSLPFATQYLLHSLMKFYIEAEFMGGHGQFFDKFNVRYEIFQIIECIWPNTVYRDNLLKEAKVNMEFFVKFVNLLLNDVTFVLDESFTAFHTIYDLTKELSLAGTTLNEQQRQEKEEALEAAKGKAKSYMQLTNQTVDMLKLFTETLADAFTMPEIVQRLADMLDYNLDAMVGTKSSSLRVGNLQEYNFNPRTLLSEIVDVYLNLSDKDNFILAVARDGRSYKPDNFVAAGNILRKFGLKSPEELAKWEKFIEKVAKAKQEDEAADADLGEIPDEFLDPLMYTLMEDPVRLPVSKIVIDRSTIRSHLLSDPHDPFNRMPLKIEDVIPATDVKEAIEKFKEERIGNRRKDFVETVKTEAGGNADGEPMDLSQ